MAALAPHSADECRGSGSKDQKVAGKVRRTNGADGRTTKDLLSDCAPELCQSGSKYQKDMKKKNLFPDCDLELC